MYDVSAFSDSVQLGMANEPSKASTSSLLPADNVDLAPSESDEDGAPEDSEQLTKKCLQNANELKLEATEYFKSQDWSQALALYTSALGRLPKRAQASEPYEGPPSELEDIDERDKDHGESKIAEEKSEEKPEPVPLTGLKLECAKARAVLNANIGACHVKLEEYKEAVKACSEALNDDPNYIKALQRRASCSEKIGSWSSLASAQDDYNTLLKLLPPDSSQIGVTKRSLAGLKPRIEEAQKKETSEMIEKLKGIGNSILGNFGLSTDNFKFEPNGQGGYSMNFAR